MKKILVMMSLLMMSTAFAGVTIDENYKATFSDYNMFDKLVKCSPGFRGGFATADTITMVNYAVDTGQYIAESFRASSDIGLKSDPPNSKPGPRPYNEGCKQAIEQLKAAIAGKDVVEVTVNRSVSTRPDTAGRVTRKVDGEVLKVDYLTHEHMFESFKFSLAGMEFFAGQIMNGALIK